MATLTKLYTIQEASQHNKRDDCWLVLDGKVYDVTPYLDEHPGGDDVLINATGRDAIEDFDFVGHSKNARELLQTFCIGKLDPSSAVIPQPTKKQTDEINNKSTDTALKYWTIPVAIIVVALVAGMGRAISDSKLTDNKYRAASRIPGSRGSLTCSSAHRLDQGLDKKPFEAICVTSSGSTDKRYLSRAACRIPDSGGSLTCSSAIIWIRDWTKSHFKQFLYDRATSSGSTEKAMVS